MEIDLDCGSGVALLLYKAIRFSLGCRHDGRPSRRDEGSLELHPGLFVPVDARGQRSDHRSVGSCRHHARRDRPRSLRSRAAQGARPAARRPSRPRSSFRGQGGPGRSHHQRPDRAPRRRQVPASHPRLGATLASSFRSHVFPGVRRVRARRAARQDPRRADRACARGTHHRGDRARRHRDRSAREAGPDEGQRRQRRSAGAR